MTVCSLKTRSLVVSVASMAVAVATMVWAAREIVDDEEEEEEEASRIDGRVLTDVVLVCAIGVVFTAVLAFGVVKESRVLFLPWLLLAGIGVGIASVCAVYLICFGFGDSRAIGVVLLAGSGACCYGWTTVASFYARLRASEEAEEEERRREARETGATLERTPPPPYTVTCEKPPPYEEVERF